MSALALHIKRQGFHVSGSDVNVGETVEKLRACGIEVCVGKEGDLQRVEEADAVVYTDAISPENKELLLAKSLLKQLWRRAEVLGELIASFPFSVAVAGSHGKTTATAMYARILKAARLPFTAFIGGEDQEMGNYFFCGEEYVVAEACEYKKNLLLIPAKTRIVLNVDQDHMECYRDFADLTNTFLEFAKGGERLVVCAEGLPFTPPENAVTFGVEKWADYQARELKNEGERYAFTVYEFGKRLCRVRLKAVGKCHVYNALAAFASARLNGLKVKEIKAGLERFSSVKRRFEELGKLYGATVIADYAHHPKELASTLATAKKIFGERLIVVFQPHTYSRTKALLEEFVAALRGVERLMLYKTYPAREKYDGAGSAKLLAERVGDCLYTESKNSLAEWLRRTAKENDCILFLGAGDIYYLAKYLVSGVKSK
ncbi:MAG: UDP-N-acetylmuramate--L-alanine ligase [Clostridia bacterium]|nr:UDP-N-acetylmuramate--L-alanine ligase [Clostridia bacterium]